jgi:hypothetical protein
MPNFNTFYSTVFLLPFSKGGNQANSKKITAIPISFLNCIRMQLYKHFASFIKKNYHY